MRLFVALRLEPDLEAAVVRLQTKLRGLDPEGRVRWTEPHGIHLTLQFLGEVDGARLPDLETALTGAAAGRTAPVLSLGGAGAFPNLRRPRVLWVGLTERGERLLPLQHAVEAGTAALGWVPERRAFQPHLTLGRAREERGRASALPPALLELVSAGGVPGPLPGPQGRLALMRSHLSPRGARYEEIRIWKLEVDSG